MSDPMRTHYDEFIAKVYDAAKLGRGPFVQLSGKAVCALHAGEPTPDLTPLIEWLEKYPPVVVDDVQISAYTRDVALFGKTLASHLLELRLEKRYGKCA